MKKGIRLHPKRLKAKAKPIFEWSDKELESVYLNSRALVTLINGLTQNEFYKVMNIIGAKELWDYPLKLPVKALVK